jgi:uncharacterized SAM-binding protein YcdF (DUF218 family)
MFLYLSKILPLLVYPLGLACILLLLAFVFRGRWQKGVITLAFLLLFLAGNRWVAGGLARSLEWRYFPPQGSLHADVIVVLAGETRAEEFPRSMPEVGESGDRLLYAAHLYHQGAAPLILHSGGFIDWLETGDNPGQDAPLLLGMMGVPREVVLLETDSRNTYESAVACRKILEERGLRRVILVTSASHMPRAVGVFKRQGIDVIPAPTDYTVTQADRDFSQQDGAVSLLISILPSSENLGVTTRMLKEYIGIFVYKLQGWL